VTRSLDRLEHERLPGQCWDPTRNDGTEGFRTCDGLKVPAEFRDEWIDRARKSNPADRERPSWSPFWSPFFCLDLTCGGPQWRELERVKAPKPLQMSQDVSVRLTGATGLEPATSGVTGRRSNQLSYAPGGHSV